MLSIRMRRTGSKKRPYYRVVVAEARDPREGAFKEILGTYNPRSKPATVAVDRERLNHWIKVGARPSDSVRTLIARHLTKDRSAVAGAVTAEPVAPTPTARVAVETPPEPIAGLAPETPPEPIAGAEMETSPEPIVGAAMETPSDASADTAPGTPSDPSGDTVLGTPSKE